jgi:hypothetical protein
MGSVSIIFLVDSYLVFLDPTIIPSGDSTVDFKTRKK